jgi:hypothetical protein
MKNTKLIIDQWKNVKVILIANLCDEQTQRRLKALVLHFVQQYEQELKDFKGDIRIFTGAKSLVEEHLLQKPPSEKKEAIVLPLYLIRGIGITRTWEFQKLGITSINELVKADVSKVARKVNVGDTLVENWIEQGKKLLNQDLKMNDQIR